MHPDKHTLARIALVLNSSNQCPGVHASRSMSMFLFLHIKFVSFGTGQNLQLIATIHRGVITNNLKIT